MNEWAGFSLGSFVQEREHCVVTVAYPSDKRVMSTLVNIDLSIVNKMYCDVTVMHCVCVCVCV